MNPKLSIGYFISPHGFGHAARASAVMNAIHARWPFVHFEIFTQIPEWFFKNSLTMSYAYHSQFTDIGLIQTSPLCFDLDKTIDALDGFLPFNERQIAGLAKNICNANCRMILCDIAPMGIAVAKQAGVSSVLIENFTWDWIYESYLTDEKRFLKHIDYLKSVFALADHRIQTEPVCDPKDGLICLPPIARSPRTSARFIREQLGIHAKEQLVLITMGGISEKLRFIDRLQHYDKKIYFIVPGAASDLPETGEKVNNVIFLPYNSAFYHPDLVNAADAIIGKVGYSTLAEVFYSGIPFGYITRSNFRESSVLETFIQSHLNGIPISEPDFYDAGWLEQIPELLALSKRPHKDHNGADIAAEHICNILADEQEIIEVVDIKGRIVGAAPRKQVHGNNQWLHRVVHVLVLDSKNRLLLQKRSLDKRVAPGKWDTSVGGHVDCGETIETAMLREMQEELGICPITTQFAYQYVHSNDFESELVFTYVCNYNKKINFNRKEIDAVKFWEMAEIETHLGSGILSDNFEDEFERFRNWTTNN